MPYIGNMIKFQYVYQKELAGLGDAIKYAKDFVAKDPFVVLVGDDVIVNNTKPAIKQCMDVYYKTKGCVVAIKEVNKKDISKYGCVEPDSKMKNNYVGLKSLVEKPSVKEAKSNLAMIGRFVLTNDIFAALNKVKRDKSNEIQLTEAINNLLPKHKVYACKVDGNRYDIGDRLGLVKATLDFALADKEMSKAIKQYIRTKKL